MLVVTSGLRLHLTANHLNHVYRNDDCKTVCALRASNCCAITQLPVSPRSLFMYTRCDCPVTFKQNFCDNSHKYALLIKL